MKQISLETSGPLQRCGERDPKDQASKVIKAKTETDHIAKIAAGVVLGPAIIETWDELMGQQEGFAIIERKMGWTTMKTVWMDGHLIEFMWYEIEDHC